ncbi:hypothetical protein ABHZ63_26795, partial [Phocaeicola vulgatus]
IVTAKGPGYDTVEDAKASKPSNTALDYEISVDNRDSYEVVANNDFFLGVSNSVFIAYTSEGANFEVFKLITDCRTRFPNACRISDNGNEVGIGVPHLMEREYRSWMIRHQIRISRLWKLKYRMAC